MKTASLIVSILLASSVGIARAEGPVNYPDEGSGGATPAVSTKTRAEVKAELAEARRLGLVVYGEVNDKIATPEQEKMIADAGSDPATLAVSTKTRAQVKAELAEARKLGLIVYGEVNDKIATPEQEQMIADAGRRVSRHEVAER